MFFVSSILCNTPAKKVDPYKPAQYAQAGKGQLPVLMLFACACASLTQNSDGCKAKWIFMDP